MHLFATISMGIFLATVARSRRKSENSFFKGISGSIGERA